MNSKFLAHLNQSHLKSLQNQSLKKNKNWLLSNSRSSFQTKKVQVDVVDGKSQVAPQNKPYILRVLQQLITGTVFLVVGQEKLNK